MYELNWVFFSLIHFIVVGNFLFVYMSSSLIEPYTDAYASILIFKNKSLELHFYQ